jgi:imidazolonepropionase-like amidohydrolase
MTKFRLLPLLLLALSPVATAATPPALVLTHITVIDATGAAAKPDLTVVITGNRIAEIGSATTTHIPKGAQVIDATGKFLIPGLWDMHVHWGQKDYLPLFLANGVTGIRIMWGDPEHLEWRRQVEAGELLAPHLFVASTLIDGPKPFWPGSISVSNEAEARQAVVQAKKAGADFVKVYSFLPREEYFAIADEARRQEIPFEGHVPIGVSAEEASRAGQKSIEHLFGILPACSTRSADLLEAAQADLDDDVAAPRPAFWGAHSRALRQMELDTYSPRQADSLFAVLKQNDTWVTPTLTLLRVNAFEQDPASFTNDPRLKYMPPRMRNSWNPPPVAKDYGDPVFAEKEFKKDLEVVGALQAAGVGILAGTDTSNPYCMPGFSLHDELGLLVKAGLTPMEALQAATLNPARFMHREKDLGTIEPGKIADLVVLDANPLDNIANTRKISAVVYAGKLLDRAQIDGMLSGVEAIASRQPISAVLLKTILEKDAASALKQYHDLKATQPAAYDFSENELITLGYRLLSMKRIPDAIEIFKLTVEAYPQSSNAYDSLAEAYMDHGDTALAIKNYQESVKLNPANTNAIQKIAELKISEPKPR